MGQRFNGIHVLNKDSFFASLVTPVVNAILISNTKPFGSMPNKAAADAITEILIEASRMNSASKIV